MGSSGVMLFYEYFYYLFLCMYCIQTHFIILNLIIIYL